MTDAIEPPLARIALIVGDLAMPVGSVDSTRSCDMELVDELLRFQFAANRLGLRIRITDVRGDLWELFELLGVTDVLEA